MKTVKSSTLRLSENSLVDQDKDHPIDLSVFSVLLPCRKFRVEHKVSVLGKVSLTAEFLLRLLKTVPGMAENDVAAFFGFDRREMSYVLSETEGAGYIERKEGRLWLTNPGHFLFREGASEPAIFAVETRTNDVGFDLISLAPQKPNSLDPFERKLPELEILDVDRVGNAAVEVFGAFRKFYSEIAIRSESPKAEKKELYSIDNILPLDRFSSVVSLVVRSQASSPSRGTEGDLTDWRPAHEQDDRPEVLNAIAAFIEKHKVSKREDDGSAYSTLIQIAPEFLDEWSKKDGGLSVERYYKEVLTRTGELQSNRLTIAMLGSVLLSKNRDRFFDALVFGSSEQSILPNHVFWLAPQIVHWGATPILGEMIDLIKAHFSKRFGGDEGAIKSICLSAGQGDNYLHEAFDHVCNSVSPNFPRGLEVLLVPGFAMVALVHAPIGTPNGYPVPLGFVSYDKDVIKRTHELFRKQMAPYYQDRKLYDAAYADLGWPAP